MQVNERKLDNYTDLSWAASTTKKLALPRERFIERIRMLLTITGTGTVTAADGGVAAQISNIKIVGNGDTLVNIKPQDLKRAMDIELGRLGKTNTPVSGTGTGGLMELILPFNPTPRNLFNFKCALPAYAFNSLDLVIDWGTAAAIGAGYVTSAATLQVQIREVYLTKGEIDALQPVPIRYTYQEKNHDATYSAQSFKINLPVGKKLWKLWLEVLDTSARTNSGVTDFRVYDNIARQDRLNQTFGQMQLQNSADYGFPDTSMPTGFGIIDLAAIGGIDARAMKSGDITLEETVALATATAQSRVTAIEIG